MDCYLQLPRVLDLRHEPAQRRADESAAGEPRQGALPPRFPRQEAGRAPATRDGTEYAGGRTGRTNLRQTDSAIPRPDASREPALPQPTMRPLGLPPLCRGCRTLRRPQRLPRLHVRLPCPPLAARTHRPLPRARHSCAGARPLSGRGLEGLSLCQRRALQRQQYRDTAVHRRTQATHTHQGECGLRLERDKSYYLRRRVREHAQPRDTALRWHALHLYREHPQGDRPALHAPTGARLRAVHHQARPAGAARQTRFAHLLRPRLR